MLGLSNNFESTESFYDHDGAVVVWLEFYLPNGLLNMRTWASVPPVLGPIAFEVGSIPDLLWMCDLGLEVVLLPVCTCDLSAALL